MTKKQPAAEEAAKDTETVVALRDGYFGSYREAGEVFEVPKGAKARWWVSADPVEKNEADDLV